MPTIMPEVYNLSSTSPEGKELMLSAAPEVVYADTLFGTGKKRQGREGQGLVYQDGQKIAQDFTYNLIEAVWEILPENGTFWLHCNERNDYLYRAHLEKVFGSSSFLGQVAWCYASGGRPRRRFAMKHDTIFWYAKDPKSDYTYDPPRIQYRSLKPGEVKEGFDPLGKPITSWWDDISFLSTSHPERTGYPTQKPEKLLERIIGMSSKEGDTVLDPCCGSGTTLSVAQKMGRNGVGFDINPDAVRTTLKRLSGAA